MDCQKRVRGGFLPFIFIIKPFRGSIKYYDLIRKGNESFPSIRLLKYAILATAA